MLHTILVAFLLAFALYCRAADQSEVARLEVGAAVIVLTNEADVCESGMTMFLVSHPHNRGFKGCWFIKGDMVFLYRGEDDIKVMQKSRFKFANG